MPFTLTHPKPPPTPSPSRQFDQQYKDGNQAKDIPIDHNLIQLDAKFDEIFGKENEFIDMFLFSFDGNGHDDDFIFEEFARIRLKGHEDPDETET